MGDQGREAIFTAFLDELKESAEVFTDFKERTATETDFRLRKLDDAFQAVIHTVQQFFGELETKIDEARNIAERLEAKAKTFVSTTPSDPVAEVPKMVEADMGQNSEGFAKTDFRDEISVLSQVAPEAEKPKTDNLPKFKAPKFTPKTDEEYEQEDYAEDLAPEEENTYGDGISETDDFASFGGVDDELPIGSGDLRNMDIMDMDLKKWETYGKEEVIPFDDQT